MPFCRRPGGSPFLAAAPRSRSPFLGLLPWPERQAVARALRTETVGGLVLLDAAVVALVWANTPFGAACTALPEFRLRIPAQGLDLSVGHWASDGLLTVFFLVAGTELKREPVVSSLRTPVTPALPVRRGFAGRGRGRNCHCRQRLLDWSPRWGSSR
ncbi:Na+/H+ antiporter NhaA [Streptomyces europaeiscabiei]|uniref:Na+/H+ antiporter NhaA n=1 Tax=Streptomyces europaeiscabiei TaxID=146819 RepID=UPI0038D38588